MDHILRKISNFFQVMARLISVLISFGIICAVLFYIWWMAFTINKYTKLKKRDVGIIASAASLVVLIVLFVNVPALRIYKLEDIKDYIFTNS